MPWTRRRRPAWRPGDGGSRPDAAEDAAGLGTGTIRLKWPNDLVIVAAGPGASLRVAEAGAAEARARLSAPLEIRKLAGILGETEGLGTDDPRAVVGIGINADWPAADFPADLAASMTSLRDISRRRVDREAILIELLESLDR